MSDFAKSPDTRPVLMVPTMGVVLEQATPGLEAAPDFLDEPTVRREVCWQHGEFYLSDSGVRVRLPLWRRDCWDCSVDEMVVTEEVSK